MDEPVRRVVKKPETKFEPAKEEIFSTDIDQSSEKAGDELIAYVEKHIAMMNNKLLFNGNREPSLYELDMALSTYEQTLFSVTALYEQAKFDADIAKAKYDEWYNNKYMEIRNKYNTKDVKNAQWLSSKEIDATLFTVYKSEAAALRSNIILCEGKRSTAERLCKAWEQYLWVLNTLSKNSQAQYNASGNSVDLRRGDELE